MTREDALALLELYARNATATPPLDTREMARLFIAVVSQRAVRDIDALRRHALSANLD